MKRYNFHLDDEVLVKLKERAYRERTTVSDLIRDAIDNHLHAERTPHYIDTSESAISE